MSTQSVGRPASVTFVVVLTWVVAILTIAASVILLFTSDQTLIDAGVSPSTARIEAWVGLGLGLVIALFASALGHGSRFARLLVTLLMMFRFVFGVIAMVVLWGSAFFWSALVMTVFALLILSLLWNSRAAEFFAKR
jgi:hypothetical protein